LGNDTLSVYQFNDTNGQVSLVGNRIKTVAGAGPRHIIFHPTKPLAFVCNELNSTTNVYRVDTSSGQLEYLQTIKTRRQEDENKENYTAELQFTPDGKYLLVSNRGDENLVIFNLNENNDEVLSVKEHLDCRGSFTRYFTFDPTGKFLLVANQKSDNLVCFSYNRDNGTYTFVSELDNIRSPQHIVFLE
jgi:6-phosphogluconolactonase